MRSRAGTLTGNARAEYFGTRVDRCDERYLQCVATAVSIQRRNRPAKQVRGTTLVEPLINEQGPRSYIWLGVLSASPERLMSHGRVPPS
jgi:hypothetical protein